MAKTLVLFDFDGTMTHKDSFLVFVRYVCGNRNYWTGLLRLCPYIFLFFCKLYPNKALKEKFIEYFFSKMLFSEFQLFSQKFALKIIPTLLKSKALETLKQHLANGHEVWIVSASLENYLVEWAKLLNIKVLATRIELIDNRITGRLASENCWGQEKVRRIREAVDLESYDSIIAYGDTQGDKEMLALANQKFYRYF